MKRIMSILTAATMCISANTVFAKDFSDVSTSSMYYNAVNALSDRGIITGYEDDTFRVKNSITRAEAATIILRASGEKISGHIPSAYADIDNGFWACDYIMQATKMGIVNGVGDGSFAPNDPVTYKQIIKMIVCMLNMGDEAERKGGWPEGYLKLAKESYIISESEYSKYLGTAGDTPAIRGEVANLIYNAIGRDEYKLTVDNEEFYLGMNASELGEPDEILPSTQGFDWYVFGTDTYEDFFAAGVINEKVVCLSSSGIGFEYNGYVAGDLIDTKSSYTYNLEVDVNDKDKIHSVFILHDLYKNSRITEAERIAGESKMNFHFVNAFRVYNDLNVLKWSEDAAEAARLHSEDMASNDYFSHDSIDGREFTDRLAEEGITNWRSCGENISAGRYLGYDAYCGWVTSNGHRENMLGDFKHLGVGGSYDKSSRYGCYFTQDFYR